MVKMDGPFSIIYEYRIYFAAFYKEVAESFRKNITKNDASGKQKRIVKGGYQHDCRQEHFNFRIVVFGHIFTQLC